MSPELRRWPQLPYYTWPVPEILQRLHELGQEVRNAAAKDDALVIVHGVRTLVVAAGSPRQRADNGYAEQGDLACQAPAKNLDTLESFLGFDDHTAGNFG